MAVGPGESGRVPPPALALGLGGLIPFISLAGGTAIGFMGLHDALRHALIAYAAVILSFVGAVHWGIALNATVGVGRSPWQDYTWSVIPALLAWTALLLPPTLALALLVVTFLVQLVMDFVLSRHTPVPSWYLKLRVFLTTGVVLSLAVAVLN